MLFFAALFVVIFPPVHRLIIFAVCALLVLSGRLAVADDVRSIKDLNELLQPEPFINLGSDGQLTQLPDQSTERVANGKLVYQKNCAACHGSKLEGQKNWNKPTASGLLLAPPHDASGHTWHHADDQLYEYIKYGPAVALGDPGYRSTMPAFGDVLSDDDILNVLVFIRSTWPDKERAMQKATNDDQSGR